MEKLNKLSKIFLYISTLSGIIWLGSYISRILVTYQLFKPKGLQLKDYVNEQNLYGILYTISSAISITFVLFIVFLISFFIFILTSKINLKKEGWLFITLVIILITAPFEIYLMTIDYKIISKVFFSIFDSNEILQLYVKRIKQINSFPLIEIFSYFGIIYLFLFQPLKLKSTDENKRE